MLPRTTIGVFVVIDIASTVIMRHNPSMIVPDSLAPCGVNCDLCMARQRTKNRCVGCNREGNKPYHCTVCSIISCPEKQGDPHALCSLCGKFPCRRIKDMSKRYARRYGVDLIEELRYVETHGMDAYVAREEVRWTCPSCGDLLCMHNATCLRCGCENPHFPNPQS